MRVLMTTDTVGGVWTFTRELCAGLLAEGASVALASVGPLPNREQLRWGDAMERQWGERFRLRGVDAPLEWMQANESAYKGAEAMLLPLAEEFAPDVVHANQFCFGALAVGVPKVVTAHSDVLSWGASCRGGMEDSPWLRRYRALVCDGLAGCDVVIAPTRWMMNAVGEHFALPWRRWVIANGRDVEAGSANERRLQAVTVGRLWDEAKGIATLADVRSPMPLLVAGEAGCDGARAPEIVGEAKLLGVLGEAEVPRLFRESAVYVCTSRYEPFGLAPLEAALCGCAVVARDLESLREVWGEDAIFFRDADGLSEVLRRLSEDAALLAEAQARCGARARRYSRMAMTREYRRVFAQVTKRDAELADVA
jgi:glycosyltransferase involved in cell wall biosynthesis